MKDRWQHVYEMPLSFAGPLSPLVLITKKISPTNIFCFHLLYYNQFSKWKRTDCGGHDVGLELKLFLHSSQSGGGIGKPKPM